MVQPGQGPRDPCPSSPATPRRDPGQELGVPRKGPCLAGLPTPSSPLSSLELHCPTRPRPARPSCPEPSEFLFCQSAYTRVVISLCTPHVAARLGGHPKTQIGEIPSFLSSLRKGSMVLTPWAENQTACALGLGPGRAGGVLLALRKDTPGLWAEGDVTPALPGGTVSGPAPSRWVSTLPGDKAVDSPPPPGQGLTCRTRLCPSACRTHSWTHSWTVPSATLTTGLSGFPAGAPGDGTWARASRPGAAVTTGWEA